MKRASLTLLVLAVSAFASSGCGTVANFVTLKPKVYGGLEQDAKFFSGAHFGGLNTGGLGGGGRGALIALGLFVAAVPAELCCTAVGDTLTLPITMAVDPNWPPPKEEPQPERTDFLGYPAQYSTNWPDAGPGVMNIATAEMISPSSSKNPQEEPSPVEQLIAAASGEDDLSGFLPGWVECPWHADEPDWLEPTHEDGSRLREYGNFRDYLEHEVGQPLAGSHRRTGSPDDLPPDE